MEIFKLFGSILINNDEANKSLAKTDSSAKKVATSLGNGIKTAGKFAAAIGTAAAGAATGMYKMATNAASTADEVDKMSQKIGVSCEAYQELSFALSQSGTDVSKLQGGLKTLSLQAEKGNKYFDQLGVSLQNVDGSAKTQEELFYDITAALQKMEEGTEKTTIATQLLGKSGTELMPLFNGAAGSLDEMRQQAHDLGLVMEDETIDSGVKLTDTLDQMKRSLSAVFTQLGARLMPIVEKASRFVIENMPKINGLIEKIAPIFEKAFDEIMPVLMDLASSLLPQIMDIVTALLPLISDIFSALAPVITELVKKLAPILVKIVDKLLPPLVRVLDALTPVLDIILDALDPIFDLLLVLLDPLADLIEMLVPIIEFGLQLIKDILDPIMPLLKDVAAVLGDVLGGAITSVAGLVSDGLIPVLKGLYDFLNGDFESGIKTAGEGLVNTFSNAFGLIDSILGTDLQKWYNEITAFWRDAGAKLYEVMHADELAEREENGAVTDLRRQIVYKSNELMRQGMSAAEALENAKSAILDTSEKSALFNTRLSDELTIAEAEERRRQLVATGQLPHLANGGVVYGKTLAVVGDNPNVRSDPEIVAPASTINEVINGEKQDIIIDLLRQILDRGMSVTLDGQKVSTAVANRMNSMRYRRGGEVVY